jgi:hypothetical protein
VQSVAHAYGIAKRNGYCDCDCDSHGYGDSHGYCHRNGNCHRHGDRYGYCHRNGYSGAEAYSITETSSDTASPTVRLVDQ